MLDYLTVFFKKNFFEMLCRGYPRKYGYMVCYFVVELWPPTAVACASERACFRDLSAVFLKKTCFQKRLVFSKKLVSSEFEFELVSSEIRRPT